jgi:hypothetical protein
MMDRAAAVTSSKATAGFKHHNDSSVAHTVPRIPVPKTQVRFNFEMTTGVSTNISHFRFF